MFAFPFLLTYGLLDIFDDNCQAAIGETFSELFSPVLNPHSYVLELVHFQIGVLFVSEVHQPESGKRGRFPLLCLVLKRIKHVPSNNNVEKVSEHQTKKRYSANCMLSSPQPFASIGVVFDECKSHHD